MARKVAPEHRLKGRIEDLPPEAEFDLPTVTEEVVEPEVLEEEGAAEVAEARPLPVRFPFPWPLRIAASGLYVRELRVPTPVPPRPIPVPRVPGTGLIPLFRDELRLDVDGRYPQKTASGTQRLGLTARVHWVARLVPAGVDTWTGPVWYRDGAVASFPYTEVRITVVRSIFTHQRRATVEFRGGGAPMRRVTYRYRSPYYHPVEFEYDCAEGVAPVTSVQTCAHPNRPPAMACENLTIERVFQRAGFQVVKSAGDSVVPLAGAGPNARWSDMEMHDAMQAYWSRFANRAQWSLWVFFASLHEMGTGLGGIMFDDIGPNHRQGTAIFHDSFISQAPANDPAPAAWVQRMRFWTAVHEMGHSFNLAHSWQKALGTPWIPLANEPEARSFMNYPYRVLGGEAAFFSDFGYRFSDNELLFMRHAPERFVQMGNADWFDHHGFEGALVSPQTRFRLEVRLNRDKNELEFLEPVVVELKLENVSEEPQLVRGRLLEQLERLMLIIEKHGKPTRQYVPYARRCWATPREVLEPGQALYESVFIGAGRNGCDLADPGWYTIRAALHLDDEDIVSEPLRIRVAPPTSYDEEFIAQDFFGDDVGRILAFDGSRFLQRGNDVLREVAERLKDRKVAMHARVALGCACCREAKVLRVGGRKTHAMTSAAEAGARIQIESADEREAKEHFEAALLAQQELSAESLGHVDYKYYVDFYSRWLADLGDTQAAAKAQENLLVTLTARKVLPRVLDQIRDTRDAYANADRKRR